jgi:hypothetical protein
MQLHTSTANANAISQGASVYKCAQEEDRTSDSIVQTGYLCDLSVE